MLSFWMLLTGQVLSGFRGYWVLGLGFGGLGKEAWTLSPELLFWCGAYKRSIISLGGASCGSYCSSPFVLDGASRIP